MHTGDQFRFVKWLIFRILRFACREVEETFRFVYIFALSEIDVCMDVGREFYGRYLVFTSLYSLSLGRIFSGTLKDTRCPFVAVGTGFRS